MSTQEAYRVLGLTPPATEHDVTRAFRRVVQTAHPDRPTGSAEAFRAAGAAREVLLDSARAGERPTPPPPPPNPPPEPAPGSAPGSAAPPPPRPGPTPPHGQPGAAQRDAERRAQGGGPWDLGAQNDADTGPILRPVAERVAAPRTWRVDVPLAMGGVLAYALLVGLTLLVSGQAVAITGVSAAVLLLASVAWSSLGRVRRLPDGWPRSGGPTETEESGP